MILYYVYMVAIYRNVVIKKKKKTFSVFKHKSRATRIIVVWKVIYVLQSVGFNNGDCNFRDFGGARPRSLWNKKCETQKPSGEKSPIPAVASYRPAGNNHCDGDCDGWQSPFHGLREIIAEKQNAKRGQHRTVHKNPGKCYAYRVAPKWTVKITKAFRKFSPRPNNMRVVQTGTTWTHQQVNEFWAPRIVLRNRWVVDAWFYRGCSFSSPGNPASVFKWFT